MTTIGRETNTVISAVLLLPRRHILRHYQFLFTSGLLHTDTQGVWHMWRTTDTSERWTTFKAAVGDWVTADWVTRLIVCGETLLNVRSLPKVKRCSGQGCMRTVWLPRSQGFKHTASPFWLVPLGKKHGGYTRYPQRFVTNTFLSLQ